MIGFQYPGISLYSMRLLFIEPIANFATKQLGLHIETTVAEAGQFTVYPIHNLKELPQEGAGANILFTLVEPSMQGVKATLWYRISLPQLIKKLGVDKVIFLHGFCPKRLSVRSIVYFPDVQYLQGRKVLSHWQARSRKHILETLKNADGVITYSSTAQSFLTGLSRTKNPIQIWQATADRNYFRPYEWEEKNEVELILSGNRAFFAATTATGNEDEVVHLLKAFSIFKKWQKSSMKLIVLLPASKIENTVLQEKLAHYHFKEDVILQKYDADSVIAPILASAYGCIHVHKMDCFLLPCIQTAMTQTPCVVLKNGAYDSLIGNAAYRLDSDDIETIGQTMISMYKAENVRSHILDGLKALSGTMETRNNQAILDILFQK